jgi:hypothetical protein
MATVIRDPDRERARRSMCSTKIGYNSQAAARLAIRQMSKKKSTNRLETYKCAFCGKYHIGNKPEKKRRYTNARLRAFDESNRPASGESC